jgi:predicted nucleic acid-binding Zn ribbon protein
MPIYVYERPDGSRFEIRQGFNDNALTEDPETGVPVRRVLQPAPVIFKGSGWYKTDSRATNASGATEKKAPAAAAGASAETGAKGEKPAETAASAKEAVSDATAKTTAEIKKTAEKPATPAAAS